MYYVQASAHVYCLRSVSETVAWSTGKLHFVLDYVHSNQITIGGFIVFDSTECDIVTLMSHSHNYNYNNLFIYLFIYLFIHFLFVYLFIHLFIYLIIY
jgi:hypothetical protein